MDMAPGMDGMVGTMDGTGQCRKPSLRLLLQQHGIQLGEHGIPLGEIHGTQLGVTLGIPHGEPDPLDGKIGLPTLISLGESQLLLPQTQPQTKSNK